MQITVFVLLVVSVLSGKVENALPEKQPFPTLEDCISAMGAYRVAHPAGAYVSGCVPVPIERTT